MQGTLSGYYDTNSLLSGVRLLINWLLYALKENVCDVVKKIESKKMSFRTLSADEKIFSKAFNWCSGMDDETFILDFISTIAYLRAGFTILPTKKLYYDFLTDNWAYIYPRETCPEDCDIFNTKGNFRAIHAFNHCRLFDEDNWNVLPFTILHELSHLITFWIDPKARRQRPPNDDEEVIWKKISGYASTFYCEYCAEATSYLFSNHKYIPRKYLSQLPQVNEDTHPAFAIPYSNLLQNGYTSQYNIVPSLITPQDILNDFGNLQKHPRYGAIENYEKELIWARDNYFLDASAQLSITLICWYVNKVYDILPPINLHNLSVLI